MSCGDVVKKSLGLCVMKFGNVVFVENATGLVVGLPIGIGQRTPRGSHLREELGQPTRPFCMIGRTLGQNAVYLVSYLTIRSSLFPVDFS